MLAVRLSHFDPKPTQPRHRPNLKIMTSTHVRNLQIEDGRVCGVVAKRDGETVMLVRAGFRRFQRTFRPLTRVAVAGLFWSSRHVG